MSSRAEQSDPLVNGQIRCGYVCLCMAIGGSGFSGKGASGSVRQIEFGSSLWPPSAETWVDVLYLSENPDCGCR